LDRFIARQHFSLRTPHPEHRISINQDTEYFLEELEKAKLKYPPNRIFKFDETCWKRYLGIHQVLTDREAKL
jgi:hypothetical protein